METSYYESEEKSQRRRVIIIATLITLIVLGVAVWAIVTIISANSQIGASNTDAEVAVDDRSLNSAEAPKTEGVTAEAATSSSADSTTDSAKDSSAKDTTKADSTAVTSVPETGPEDLLPLALIAGSGAAFVTSKKLAKNEIIA